MTGRVRVVAVLAAAAVAMLSLPGCGVRLGAEHATVRIRDDKMELALPTTRAVRPGEVVITIENYTFAKRQVVLARTDLQPPALPPRLATAERGRDDKAVVAVTGRMRSATRTIAGFLPTTVPSKQSLHVHLHPGDRYVLFDRLGGLGNGQYLTLTAP
jgi:hypothetical protein